MIEWIAGRQGAFAWSNSGIFGQIDAWISATAALRRRCFYAWITGWQISHRQRPAEGEPPAEKFSEASFAVLALLVAFTFGMSLQRHDQRRTMVVGESNAIGDFYTCATLLPEPSRATLQTAIRDYTNLHLHIVDEVGRGKDIKPSLAELDRQIDTMTTLVHEAIDRGTPIAVPLTNTLNEVTSAKASRLFAIEDHVPTSVIGLLFLCTILSMFLNGMRHGAKGQSQYFGTISLVLLFGMVIYVILDLNQPGRGLIRVSQLPMERLAATMKK